MKEVQPLPSDLQQQAVDAVCLADREVVREVAAVEEVAAEIHRSTAARAVATAETVETVGHLEAPAREARQGRSVTLTGNCMPAVAVEALDLSQVR